MLEKIMKKLMPYKVIIVPTSCYVYEGDDGKEKMLFQETGGFTERFMTKRGFDKRVAKLKSNSRSNTVGSSHDWFVFDSAQPDEKTYIMVPDTIFTMQEGEYGLEVPEEFKEYFPELSHSESEGE